MKQAILVTVVFIFTTSFSPFIKGPEPSKTSLNKNLILDLVNKVRAKGCQCGDTYYYPAPALKWNDLLEKAASSHSLDMEKKKYFSHKAPDGSRAGERLDKIGYKWSTYGENIANGYENEESVVKGWLSSPGHCKNIMNKSYKEMGAGRAGNLWTQTFGAR